ncbi:hypothetical protein NY78_0524 [Desulfovibrio sp. TomC]|nr:hypothetical protein NY78_0524 [Desulfovibrio sp. TomC]
MRLTAVATEGIASFAPFRHDDGMNVHQPMPGFLAVAVRYLGVIVLLTAYGGQV